MATQPTIDALQARACTVPTDRPESDGTHAWESTTIIIVTARSGDSTGIGYTYTRSAAAHLINGHLSGQVTGRSALSPAAAWWAMSDSERNTPRQGLAMFAISAVDTALWDLMARLLDLPLVTLLGSVRESVDAYASGGFTSYSVDQLQSQLGQWAQEGFARVKMKVGRDPCADFQRVRAAREAIGPEVALFTDANGAYSVEQALRLAQQFAEVDVTWLEEPRPSSDLRGLAQVRARAPAGMAIAAGEYGDVAPYFVRLIEANAANVLQPDVTRCGGFSGLMRIAALCEAHQVPISLHCAPALSAQVACACRNVRHIEYFHDHVRLEHLLFEGTLEADQGRLTPDRSRSGNGLRLRADEIDRWSERGAS